MKASAQTLPLEMNTAGIQTHGDDWGEFRMRHITLPPGVDFTPLFEGLPQNLCQCPHWGYVVDGSITLRFADGREETTRAGEMYYWPAGHTGWTNEGVTFIEVSPVDDIATVMQHLANKMSADA